MDLFSLGINLDTSRLRRGLADIARFTRSTKDAELAAKGLASTMSTVAVAVGSAVGAMQSVNTIMQFEDAMLGLQATTRGTTDQMAALEAQARSLGATSVFSATETANAQRFLAQAGFDVNQVLASSADTLRLAQAGQLGLAEAADIASNVLGGMRLEVSELSRVNDVMAETAANSNTNIRQLGEALSYAAPLAAGAGVSLEKTASAIGILSNNGLQASRAGTGFLGIIRQLSKPSSEAATALRSYGLTLSDVDIEARGLTPVMRSLAAANIDTADTFRIFGSEAGPAAQILMANVDATDQLTTKLNQSNGAAKEMARVMSSGLSSSFKSFNSQVSESILQLGDSGLAQSLQDVTDTATGVLAVYNDMLPEFAEANELTDDQSKSLESLAGNIEIFAGVLGGAVTGLIAYRGAALAATLATAGLSRVMLANPLGIAITAIGAASGLMLALSESTQSASEAMGVLADESGRFNNTQKEAARLRLLEEAKKLEEEIIELRSEQEKNKIPGSENLPDNIKALHAINDEWSGVNGKLTIAEQKLGKIKEQLDSFIAPTTPTIVTDVTDDFNAMLDRMSVKPFEREIEQIPIELELGYMQYYQARADAEDELNQQIIENADAEKRRLEDLMGMINSIASGFGAGLVTGDFSGASGALSGLIQSQAETGISSALTSSLGAATAGIFGAAGGGIAGALASDILSGKKEISRAVTIALEDGVAQVSTDIKFGSIFGSSISSLKFNSADNELANNSINNVLKNLSKTFKEIDVTVSDFSGSFTGDTFAGAIENMAEQFINGGFESIDAFRNLGQSTEDALTEFVAKIKNLSESMRNVVGTDLDESVDQFIDQRAQAIDTNAEKAVDFWQSYLRVIDDITNGATEPLETGEQYLNAFTTASDQLTNEYGGSITRLRKDIAFIEQNQLSEAIGRLGEGDLVAYGQFAESLADLVKDGDVTAAFDALNSVISTDTQTYAEIITNAREDLEGLGFDGNISAENFAKQYSDALANGIDENVLANYLNAGILLKNIGDATESLNDEAKETADNLLALESRLQSALGNDDAATLIDRQIELANAASPAAAALLELIYDAEDAEIAFNNSAEALERLSDAQMNATDAALSSLSRLTQEQQEILRDAYDDNVDAAKDAITDLSDSIGDLESVAESLKNAIGETVDVSVTVARLQLSSARQQIAAFAASGVLPDADTLEELLNRVTGDTAQYYATAEDYYREQGRTANDLAMLSELADDQLSEAERSLKAQEDQVDLLKDQYDLASEALDDQLQAAYDQVSILRNTYDTTTTIAEALDNILIAMNAEEAGTSAFTATEIKGAAESIFGSITSAGGSEDDAYRAIAEEAIRNGVSGSELAMALGVPLSTVQDITGRLNIPGFANGGINTSGGLSMTGERGMEIVNMPAGSHTTNANETKRLLDNSGVEALLAELLNKATSSNTNIKRTYDILNRVTEDGNAVNTNSVIVGNVTGA